MRVLVVVMEWRAPVVHFRLVIGVTISWLVTVAVFWFVVRLWLIVRFWLMVRRWFVIVIWFSIMFNLVPIMGSL